MNTSSQKFEKLVKRPYVGGDSFKKPTIVQVFLNADLRGSHNALTLLAKSHHLDLTTLGSREAVVFINKARTLMKIFVAGNTFSFTRRDRIDLDAIRHIPKAFGANNDFSYDTALAMALNEKLAKKRKGLVH